MAVIEMPREKDSISGRMDGKINKPARRSGWRKRSEMRISVLGLVILAASFGVVRAEDNCRNHGSELPADIKAVFEKPLYKNAIWGLRVIDLGTEKELINLKPHHDFFIGSVRKVFTVGELLNAVDPAHRYNTPVYRHGAIDHAGVLHGSLILVASGDLTMGGRTNPDGTIAFTNFDHNEADSLGNAVLTKPNPLAGYIELARQITSAGIKEITGDVVIDDRLFQPFNFRGEFDVKPIFVNDDVVDLVIRPTAVGDLASVRWRPVSAALGIENTLVTTEPGSDYTLKLNPVLPQCIGMPSCAAEITGQLPADFVPPLTNKYPLVQTVRIVEPSNYARTVFIEELKKAGIRVDASLTAENPNQLLPRKGSYSPDMKMAELKGLPYSDDAKLILKVSYNIGADTSLVLFGLTQGVDNMSDALQVERRNLVMRYGIPLNEFHFVDGSGGGSTTATNRAVTRMLEKIARSRTFRPFFDLLPILGIDGSLAFVTEFQSDPTLAGATGHVRAKTGTFLEGSDSGLVLKGQAFGGYIHTKGGRHLVYQLVVNNVTVSGLPDVIQVFQDEGKISAILWRDH
jgi:D-alanyl-D-alanine carboxypeptidase